MYFFDDQSLILCPFPPDDHINGSLVLCGDFSLQMVCSTPFSPYLWLRCALHDGTVDRCGYHSCQQYCGNISLSLPMQSRPQSLGTFCQGILRQHPAGSMHSGINQRNLWLRDCIAAYANDLEPAHANESESSASGNLLVEWIVSASFSLSVINWVCQTNTNTHFSVCIASIYRTIIVKRLSHSDASWADVDPEIWAVVENAIGIVSATLPTLRPIYSVVLRGHHCSATEKAYCSRCTAKTKPSAISNGSDGSTNNRRQNRNDSFPSVVESVEKRGHVTATEMCWFAGRTLSSVSFDGVYETERWFELYYWDVLVRILSSVYSCTYYWSCI